ncbi:DUF2553 family protein, partial [Bacillus subtilis]|uniref:DUF2553 family protein n=1 Tax=Bacillus subtilis TaxID=1423 RepID=UPI0011AA04EC
MPFHKQNLHLTNDLTGPFQNPPLSLYHHNHIIPQITTINQYHLNSPYSFQNHKFYKTAGVVSRHHAKY